MNTLACIAHFGNKARLARALGIEPPSVSEWKEFPPALRQLQIERLTGGKLKAEPNCIAPDPAKQPA